LLDARTLPADLPADDFCRPAFGAGLKAPLVRRRARVSYQFH
jgi:hypothetical protein